MSNIEVMEHTEYCYRRQKKI